MRIVFCGTPQFAVPALKRLLSEPDFTIEAVVTQPDRPRGRAHGVASPPVKDAALDAGLHVYQPEKIRSDSAYDFFQRIAPDAVVIIAYGQIIPARLLSVPRLGWMNLHASLLPKYRGAAPVNWAIINGETQTGLTTMQIDPGMDTGPILVQHTMGIGSQETAPELARRMAEAGAPLVVTSLRGLERGELTPAPQDNAQASLAPLLKKEDGRIPWALTAEQIYNRIRGLEPWPGAFTTFRGQLCHVWGKPGTSPGAAAATGAPAGTLIEENGELCVACGEHSWLLVEAVQLEGRKRISGRDFVNGARIRGLECFGTSGTA